MENEKAIKILSAVVQRSDAIIIGDEVITSGEIDDALNAAIEALQERKTGKWISDSPFHKNVTLEDGQVSCSCRCSECGDWLTASDEYPCRGYYCPNCGAKMEVDDGNEHKRDC